MVILGVAVARAPTGASHSVQDSAFFRLGKSSLSSILAITRNEGSLGVPMGEEMESDGVAALEATPPGRDWGPCPA